MAYRNIYYDINNSNVHLWCWDKTGQRTKVIEHFEPYLFIESENGTDGTSIFQTPLKKIKFKSQYDRIKFLKEINVKLFREELEWEVIKKFITDHINYKTNVGNESRHKFITHWAKVKASMVADSLKVRN